MGADEQAIRALQAQWFEATSRGDLPALLALMADDVVFLTPGRPPFGREEFAASFQAGLRHVRVECHGEFEEIVVVGDVAYARARLAVTVTPVTKGDVQHLAGYTLSVHRKQADGRWLLARDANLLSLVPELP